MTYRPQILLFLFLILCYFCLSCDISNTKWFEAVRNGDLENVQSLLEKGININSANDYGITALMLAASNGHIDITSFLIEEGADLLLLSDNNQTAWCLANKYENKEIATLLFPSYLAVLSSGNQNLIQLMTEEFFYVNLQNSDQKTALMIAVEMNLENTVRTLLSKGAKIDLEDSAGKTAWDLALQNNNENIKDLLRLQTEPVSEIYWVSPQGGLNFWNSPDRNKEKLTVLPYGWEVRVLARSLIEEEIGGVQGRWVHIEENSTEVYYRGWVFDPYLTDTPDISFFTTAGRIFSGFLLSPHTGTFLSENRFIYSSWYGSSYFGEIELAGDERILHFFETETLLEKDIRDFPDLTDQEPLFSTKVRLELERELFYLNSDVENNVNSFRISQMPLVKLEELENYEIQLWDCIDF